ncbi:MAG: DNA repair and recombination protein RadB [Thermoplasmata archaeon]|nr:MAG: DNA repair and recombination protein RadB [Thermoplasmata archaeon]RLF73654.1 MAG: DNA repair and recombination protein RadB [Thermoplasmata archaeon]HDD60622.1 DNA repair and recombination protein RadB [Euryarchaeota archaeon]
MRIPLGCRSLDELLGGGFESGAITELFGEGGSGKTNICLQLARNVAREGLKVIYIDTEGVSLERLEQMCSEGGDFEDVLKRILFFEPYSLKEQERSVERAIKITEAEVGVGLVVLDSATVFYRMSLGRGRDERERHILAKMTLELLKLARQRDIPVVITTQVYSHRDGADVMPIGGHSLSHNAKTIIKLEKAGEKGLRRAILVKHRSRPSDLSALFLLTQRGVEDLPQGFEEGE